MASAAHSPEHSPGMTVTPIPASGLRSRKDKALVSRITLKILKDAVDRIPAEAQRTVISTVSDEP